MINICLCVAEGQELSNTKQKLQITKTSSQSGAMIQVEFIRIDVPLIVSSLLISSSQAVKSMRPLLW